MKGIGQRRLGRYLAAALVGWFLLGSGSGEAMAARTERLPGAHLTRYREAHQGAFYMLIPKGWKAEGGMIPSGVEWNVVDLVEDNIRFRVTSPDGMSFFGWYPRFYFQDPQTIAASSGGVLQPQPGQVLNGCWLYPYLNVSQYVQYIVLNQLSAAEFEQPLILGEAIRSEELKPWVPTTATRSDIQEEFYKVITEQIETYDPQTNRIEHLPMYNFAWTDGRGSYILRDYDDGTLPVENAAEWRQLKIINRNEPGYRSND